MRFIHRLGAESYAHSLKRHKDFRERTLVFNSNSGHQTRHEPKLIMSISGTAFISYV